DVRAAFERLAAAAKALDTEAYFSHFDKDAFVGLNSDGRNWNDFSAFETVVTGGFAALARVDELVFVNVKISVLDASNAVLVNEYEQSVTLKSGATMDLAGGGTQVWSKRSGQWKLVSVSASNRSGLP
ncbi:MAG: nuclear transport factor 2 family protein, partial [Bacteroidota bacterium]